MLKSFRIRRNCDKHGTHRNLSFSAGASVFLQRASTVAHPVVEGFEEEEMGNESQRDMSANFAW